MGTYTCWLYAWTLRICVIIRSHCCCCKRCVIIRIRLRFACVWWWSDCFGAYLVQVKYMYDASCNYKYHVTPYTCMYVCRLIQLVTGVDPKRSTCASMCADCWFEGQFATDLYALVELRNLLTVFSGFRLVIQNFVEWTWRRGMRKVYVYSI